MSLFDYQKVELIGITKPLIKGIDTPEQFLAYCARVSNPQNQFNTETSEKLLKYCIDHQHWSIFETISIIMSVETTRDIGRQILRHRSFVFQEFSQRYADASQLGFVNRQTRLQDTKNRQNSISIDHYDDEQENLNRSWQMKQEQLQHEAKLAYKWALDNGIAKEQARAVLPEGMTMSRMYMSGSLRSWIHYCQLRMGHGTQKEHMDIAEKAWVILCDEFKFLRLL
jgi:thymidylate synthase (FAD)